MDEIAKHPVFLVDDHPLLRESLKTLVNQQPDLQICGEAADARTGLAGIQAAKPDVVVMDISLKDSSGLDLLKSVKAVAPEIAVLMLSTHDERLYAERAIRGGALGYVMKEEPPARIIEAVRQVLAGRIWLSETMAPRLAAKQSRRPLSASPLHDLSDRELEVFSMLGEGRETRQVALALDVSIKTVQAYCARIKLKLGLDTAGELLRAAVRWHEGQSQSRLP